MRYFLAIFFACILMTGCVTFKPSPSDSINTSVIEPEVLRLTQEKIEEKDGVKYIIVTFPSQSINHDCFLDEETGEYVAVGVLPVVK